MVSLLRRFQQPLMIAITVIIIISFTYFYSKNDFVDRTGASQGVATMYGRPITYAQFQRAGRKFDLCNDLGLFDLLRSLAVRQEGAKENFTWNSFVLKHEADKLGIDANDDEVVSAIQAMPAFQTNGVYDSTRYKLILDIALSPRGFTPDDMQELIRDDLRLKKLKTVLGSTVAPSESEVRTAYAEMSQKTEASVVRLKFEDFLASTQITDEDVKKAYEERKNTLKTEETRKVKFVAFVLPTTDTPLEPKARAEALGKLGKQAEDFALAMTEKDAKLEDVTAKLGGKVEESPEFARNAPPEELGKSREAAVSTFKLTTAQPNGDIVSTDRGYYFIQLAGITPPRPLTLDEAKGQLADELKRDRASEAMNLKATEIRNKIETEIKAGKSFADAAQAAGAKAEKFPTFSPMDRPAEAPNASTITAVASELNVGQLSTPTPTFNPASQIPSPDGMVIVFVENRLPMDEEKFKADKARVAESIGADQKMALFSEWLKLRRGAANLQMHGKG